MSAERRNIIVIRKPLEVPVCDRGLTTAVTVASLRVERIVQDVVRPMNVRRPKGGCTVGALLDAIFKGEVKLVRRDDPEEREFWVGKNYGPEMAAEAARRASEGGNRGCPRDNG